MNATIEAKITPEKIQEKLSRFKRGKTNRIPEILYMRLNNLTLDEIAKNFGVTRERIRQMESKGILMVLSENIPIDYINEFLPPIKNEQTKYEIRQLTELSNRTLNTLSEKI